MKYKNTAAALGLFDGLHLGHRAVIGAAMEQKKKGLMPCVFTFPPEGMAGKCSRYIYGSTEKEFILNSECGITQICSPPFEEICYMDGDSFARRILKGQLGAEFVSCGNDFRFGKGAACGVAELAGFGRKYGFDVKTVDDVFFRGERVSSTAIRQLLASGELRKANQLLGKPYVILKEVVHGAEIGRTIGFPTVNQLFDEGQLVPAFGVYASRTNIEGVWYPSMTNIGRKPTVNYSGAPLAETYISGFSGDLYGQILQVTLLDFVRTEKKFASVDELKEQINCDLRATVPF